jgi:hypothetical protein
VADGEVHEGSLADPEAVIIGEPLGFYRLMVDRDASAVSIEGDSDAVEAMLASLPPVPPARVPA